VDVGNEVSGEGRDVKEWIEVVMECEKRRESEGNGGGEEKDLVY
jgi:hypothetical protein